MTADVFLGDVDMTRTTTDITHTNSFDLDADSANYESGDRIGVVVDKRQTTFQMTLLSRNYLGGFQFSGPGQPKVYIWVPHRRQGRQLSTLPQTACLWACLHVDHTQCLVPDLQYCPTVLPPPSLPPHPPPSPPPLLHSQHAATSSTAKPVAPYAIGPPTPLAAQTPAQPSALCAAFVGSIPPMADHNHPDRVHVCLVPVAGQTPHRAALPIVVESVQIDTVPKRATRVRVVSIEPPVPTGGRAEILVVPEPDARPDSLPQTSPRNARILHDQTSARTPSPRAPARMEPF